MTKQHKLCKVLAGKCRGGTAHPAAAHGGGGGRLPAPIAPPLGVGAMPRGWAAPGRAHADAEQGRSPSLVPLLEWGVVTRLGAGTCIPTSASPPLHHPRPPKGWCRSQCCTRKNVLVPASFGVLLGMCAPHHHQLDRSAELGYLHREQEDAGSDATNFTVGLVMMLLSAGDAAHPC